MSKPTYSVLDLGSNSFHMIHARVNDGQIEVLDKFKQYVSLGAGLRDDGTIRRAYRDAAVHCLHEVRRVLRRQRPDHFAAIATNAYRRQREPQFQTDCERALGRPIRVLSSTEEGEYIYHGVVRTTPQARNAACILDIGGSSTELIVGDGNAPRQIVSWQVGSAVLTERFFSAAKPQRDDWAAALAYTDAVFAAAGQDVISIPDAAAGQGASGAIRATAKTLIAHGLTDGTIDAAAVDALAELLLSGKPKRRLRHLDRHRMRVFLGGLAVVRSLFTLLDVRSLTVSGGALREGVLLSLDDAVRRGGGR